MKKRIKQYVKIWEGRCYSNGIPDEVPKEINDLVPSYKRIAIAIMKNDYPLKTLGYSPPKSNVYSALKKIELQNRGVIKKSQQLKLF